MSVGPLQLLLVLLIVLVIFGSKKLGNIGSDLGKAIRGFKKGMDDDDKDKARAQNTQADDANCASGDASTASAKSSAHDSEASSHKSSDH